MENALKLLIAAACVVVIAVGGYWGWGEYKRLERAKEVEAIAARQRKEHRNACLSVVNDVAGSHGVKKTLNECLSRGYITNDEYEKAEIERRQIAEKEKCYTARDGLRRSYDQYKDSNVDWSKEYLAVFVTRCLADGRLAASDVQSIEHILTFSSGH